MKKLRKIRMDKGYSQRALADEIGVHYSLISRWEKGGRIPKNKERIRRLTTTLDTPLRVLFEDLNEEEERLVSQKQNATRYHQPV